MKLLKRISLQYNMWRKGNEIKRLHRDKRHGAYMRDEYESRLTILHSEYSVMAYKIANI